MKIFLLLALPIIILSGWGRVPDQPAPLEEKTPKAIVLTALDVYLPGEPVKLTLILTNEGEVPLTGTFPSGQNYDFMITNQQGEEVWRWSHDKVFTMAIRPFALAPGESLVFNEFWDQIDQTGQPIPPGEYAIEGVFKALPTLHLGTKKITIRP